jgi:hypothetical protein
MSQVQAWPRNPKKHDEPGLDASLERFGFVNPLVLDESSGKLVAGHGRLEEGKPPPERVEVRKGEWCVPVLMGISFSSEEEAEAYLLADNRLTELGGWDHVALADMLRRPATEKAVLEGTGFSDAQADRLLRTYKPPEEVSFQEYDESVAEKPAHFGLVTCECGHQFNPDDAEDYVEDEG